MVPCIFRIVLRRIVLGNNRIRRKIKKQAGILPYDTCKHDIKFVFRYDPAYHKIGTDPDTGTPAAFLFLRKDRIGKELQKSFIWNHEGIITRNKLTDTLSLRVGILFFL